MNKIAFNHILTTIIAVMMMAFSLSASAQSNTATGQVLDSDNEPLAGATVKVSGSNGTITDADGNFSIACNPTATLEISYVGYFSRQVKAGKDLRIVLNADAKTLDETVVVGIGYGTMRKSDLTGSIASVQAKDLKQGVITSTEQMLQGKVAGLSVVQSSGSPENGASLRLRGGTSLSASNGPLVVVDGIAGVDFNSVQPSEIVSIDVLKDASAAAIYGSRGANGVIIVTTNRQAGDVEKKTMEYNGYVAFASVAKKLDLLSADQWRGYVRDNNVTGALDYGANTDWQDELLRTAISHSHNFNFSNSRKNSGYRASVTYNNNEGVVERNNINRLATSLSGYQFGLNGRLRMEVGVNANFDSWHPIDSRIFERELNLNPTFPVYNTDGSFAQLNGTNTENPVEINTDRQQTNKRHRFLGYGKLEYEIIDGLKATANGSYEFQHTTGGTYKPTYARMEGQSENGWGQRTYAEYTNASWRLSSLTTSNSMPTTISTPWPVTPT
jgi:TonB-linked SusC/RagA family outer membrane protein